jgi:hypothetical protein
MYDFNLNEDVAKFIGKYIAVPIVVCLIIYKASTDAWDSFGVWAIIVPVAIAAAFFYFKHRSAKRFTERMNERAK